ncbi:MAG: DUF169 domain-containing protein [Pseudomonadota bacterium]
MSSSERWPHFLGMLDVLGLNEAPLAVFFSDAAPEKGLTPDPLPLPTREAEIANQVNWGEIFGGFSCVMGHIWRARRKNVPAYFSAENFGCLGGAFYLGFNKPQVETIIQYVSTGVPNFMEGECYLDSPDAFRAILEYVDPIPAPRKYLVVKPLHLLADDEQPDHVMFFARPEALAGLHQLASYVTGAAEAVRSPFGAACSAVMAWPYHYQARGIETAVLGGWDPSARKYFRPDELSFTVPRSMFDRMAATWRESFLTKKAWKEARRKVDLSRRTWNKSK